MVHRVRNRDRRGWQSGFSSFHPIPFFNKFQITRVFFSFFSPPLCSTTTPYNFSWWHCILFVVVNTPKPPNMRSPPPGLLHLITTYGFLKRLTQPRERSGDTTASTAQLLLLLPLLTNHQNTHLREHSPSDMSCSSTGSGKHLKWIKRPC